MTTRIRRWLEPLEDRTVPAVDVFAQGSTLFILGDRLANDVQLTRDAALVRVTADNGRTQSFAGITAVYADLGAGNDRFTAAVRAAVRGPNDPPPDPWRLTAFLGAGNDAFGVAVAPPGPNVPPSADLQGLHITCDGEAGNDSLSGRTAYSPQWQPPKFGELGFDFDGGAGDDRLNVDVQNVTVAGELAVSATGGTGGDEVGIIIINNRAGEVFQKVNGGDGSDEVGIIIVNNRVGSMSQVVDLGTGIDTASLVVSGLTADGAVSQVVRNGGRAGREVISTSLTDVTAAAANVAVFTGDSKDVVSVGMQKVQAFRGGVVVDTGAGDDTLFANFRELKAIGDENERLRDFPLSLRSGLGDDTVSMTMQKVRPDAGFTVDTAAGHDILFTHLSEVEFGDAGLPTIRTGDGHDTVGVTMQKVNTGRRGFVADTGAGDDVAVMSLTNVLTPDADLRLLTGVGSDTVAATVAATDEIRFGYTVDLGDGDDTVVLNLAIAGAGRPYLYNLLGGAGADDIDVHVTFVGSIFPDTQTRYDVALNFDGEGGHDIVRVVGVEDPAFPSLGTPTGRIDLTVRGGIGDDTITVQWPEFVPGRFGMITGTTVADGGVGFDLGFTSPNVTRLNLEN